jgi:hypothetical protein
MSPRGPGEVTGKITTLSLHAVKASSVWPTATEAPRSSSSSRTGSYGLGEGREAGEAAGDAKGEGVFVGPFSTDRGLG